MSNLLWDCEETVESLGIDVPFWIDKDITPYDVAAVCQGGCDSGAYMPAVTYWQALETMSEHGDDVLQFIEDAVGEVTYPECGIGWAGLACHFLSIAVELWCMGVEDELESILEEMEEDEDDDED